MDIVLQNVVNTKRRMSNVYCCVPLCTSSKRKNPELSFHSFPNHGSVKVINKLGIWEKVDRRKAWIKALKMNEKKTSQFMKVCSKHFVPFDFFKVGCKHAALKRNVIPTMNLPNIIHGTVSNRVRSSSVMMRGQRLENRAKIKSIIEKPISKNLHKLPEGREKSLREEKASAAELEAANTLLSLQPTRICCANYSRRKNTNTEEDNEDSSHAIKALFEEPLYESLYEQPDVKDPLIFDFENEVDTQNLNMDIKNDSDNENEEGSSNEINIENEMAFANKMNMKNEIEIKDEINIKNEIEVDNYTGVIKEAEIKKEVIEDMQKRERKIINTVSCDLNIRPVSLIRVLHNNVEPKCNRYKRYVMIKKCSKS